MKALNIFLTGCILFSACKKTTENVISKTVTPTYPVITLNGPAGVTLAVGSGAYTDAGATYYDSINKTTNPLPPLSNNVDPTTAGFYTVNFLAKNVYGYRSTATRLVLVSTISASDDISGVYKRTSNGQVVNVAKIGTGLYSVDNVGGVANNPAFVFPYYIGFTDLNDFQGPSETTPIGTLFLTNTSINRSDPAHTVLKWVVNNVNFGTSVRTFVKQ